MQRPQQISCPTSSFGLNRKWSSQLAVLALFASVMGGCEAPPGGWEVEFQCKQDAERATSLELHVLEGGCDGTRVDERKLQKDGDGGVRAFKLDPGRYGFRAVAMTVAGEEVATACQAVELPTHDTTRLLLRSQYCGDDGAWSGDGAGDLQGANTGDAGDPRQGDGSADATAAPEAAETGATGPSDTGVGEAGAVDAGRAMEPVDATETGAGDAAALPGCPPSCDDGNPCTHNTCVDGECVAEGLSLTVECDGVPCTVNDQCVRGSCVQGDPDDSVCDDANACTSETCIPSRGCSTGTLEGEPCDDELDCTSDDTCHSGQCVGLPVCEEGEECAFVPGTCRPCEADEQCDDGDPCTLDTCACDGDDCTKTFCKYVAAPDGTQCDDGADCSINDVCNEGECQGEIAPNACDDGNPCTEEACVRGFGCAANLREGACDDGLDCTSQDECIRGTCMGSDSCDDGNPCTVGRCEAQGCVVMPLDIECDDGRSCTSQDRCVDGECAGVDACDDGEACTEDRCVEGGETDTCEHVERTGACDDGLACTEGDHCEAGACVSGASTCGPNASCGPTQCTCQDGFSECGSQCVDLDTDRAHCGQCDVVCAVGVECALGRCVPEGCTHLRYGGHSYFGCSEALSWSQARQRCQEWEADLAVITSSAEHEALAGWLPVGDYWLGGSDQDREDVWRWVTPGAGRDGSPFYEECDGGFLEISCGSTPHGEDKYPDAYDNWAVGEPNDSTVEDCLELQLEGAGSGVWNDVACSTQHGFVCEGY